MDAPALLLSSVCAEVEIFLRLVASLGGLESLDLTFTVCPKGVSADAAGRLEQAWTDVSDSVKNTLQSLMHFRAAMPGEDIAVKQKKNACKTCRKQFATANLLRYHRKNVHGHPEDDHEEGEEEGDKVVVAFACCQFCYSSFRAEDDEDFREHKCENPFPKSMSDNAVMLDHNRFTCGYCREEFRRFRRIQVHLVKCQGAPFSCDVCNQGDFVTRRSLNDHKGERHSDDLAFRCDECPRRFKLNTSLQKHLRSCHEDAARPSSFVCDKCGKRFKGRVYLTNHQTRFHNLFKPFLCQVCGERFVSAPGLDSHLEIHRGTKRFSCAVCHKSFRRKDKLEFHLATHTGKRPHACGECKKSFVSKSKLADHKRRHEGLKRFSCLVCNKMYSGSSDLRLHLMRHHPNVSKNIKPNVPLTPQILNNIVHYRSPRSQMQRSLLIADFSVTAEEEPAQGGLDDDNPFEIDIEDLRTANVAIRELGFDAESMIMPSDI